MAKKVLKLEAKEDVTKITDGSAEELKKLEGDGPETQDDWENENCNEPTATDIEAERLAKLNQKKTERNEVSNILIDTIEALEKLEMQKNRYLQIRMQLNSEIAELECAQATE